jgi:hypothetical protein
MTDQPHDKPVRPPGYRRLVIQWDGETVLDVPACRCHFTYASCNEGENHDMVTSESRMIPDRPHCTFNNDGCLSHLLAHLHMRLARYLARNPVLAAAVIEISEKWRHVPPPPPTGPKLIIPGNGNGSHPT